jgi:DNA-binding NarL/FixJ family response regulator
MPLPNHSKLGSLSAAMSVAESITQDRATSILAKRRAIAQYCKLLGQQVGAAHCGDKPESTPDPGHDLAPRLRDTLKGLLDGNSEKQVAMKLKLSPHTVHVYVKSLYRHFGVTSRGELLAKCLGGKS